MRITYLKTSNIDYRRTFNFCTNHSLQKDNNILKRTNTQLKKNIEHARNLGRVMQRRPDQTVKQFEVTLKDGSTREATVFRQDLFPEIYRTRRGPNSRGFYYFCNNCSKRIGDKKVGCVCAERFKDQDGNYTFFKM